MALKFVYRDRLIGKSRKIYRPVVAMALVAVLTVAGLTNIFYGGPSAAAADGGYPHATLDCVHAPYNSTGGCTNYDWGLYHDNTSAASIYSSRGYGYRNCTDYVAWKLESMSVNSGLYTGLGNANTWGTAAAAKHLVVNDVPAVGAAAVDENGTYGHVSLIDSYNASTGQMTVSEYNKAGTGEYGTRTGTLSGLGFEKVIHYEQYEAASTPPSSIVAALMYAKTANTSSGSAEVHWASSANSYSTWAGGAATWFNNNDSANGTYTTHDMDGDGKSDLVFIKTANTTSGKVEVHWLLAADNFSGIPHSAVSWFNTSDAANGKFMMGRVDGHPDLVFVKTANTSNGKVEIHYASSQTGFASWTGGAATWFGTADSANGTYSIHDMNNDGYGDLVFIKTANTTNGKVEIHWLDAAYNFAYAPGSYSTWFNGSDAANGTFSMTNLAGGSTPYLVFIKTANTSGSVEIHWAVSTNSYSTWDGGAATWFNANNATNGKFMVGTE